MAGTRYAARVARHGRVRKRIAGTAARPRLAIFRSITHIYAQLIDDQSGRTLAAASTQDGSVSDGKATRQHEAGAATAAKTARAAAVGALLAERARAAGIEEVVFDRGGYRYHGRVKALVDAARNGGVRF
ncbi:50S ribosomal protein L18 [soil metagenome]